MRLFDPDDAAAARPGDRGEEAVALDASREAPERHGWLDEVLAGAGQVPGDDPHRELREAFAEHGTAVEGLARSTVYNRDLYVRGWLDHLAAAGTTLDRAGPSDVLAWLVAEEARGLATSTRSAQLRAVRAFHRWLRLVGRSDRDPTVDVPTPRSTRPPVETYTTEQIDRILAHTATLTDPLGRQRHAIVSVLRFTGVRSAEARGLTIDALDLDAGRTLVVGKRRSQRAVVLPRPLVATLRTFLAEARPHLPAGTLLFTNPDGYAEDRRFESAAFGREVREAAQRAGVAGRHYPHRWRHTFATELLRAGVDLHTVQRLMGHRSVRTTVQYTHLSMDDLEAALTRVWT